MVYIKHVSHDDGLHHCTGAVYLKNCVFKYWKPLEPGEFGGGPVEANSGEELPPYSIPEQSKGLIRDNIVGAVIHTPLLIRCVHCAVLSTCGASWPDMGEGWAGCSNQFCVA